MSQKSLITQNNTGNSLTTDFSTFDQYLDQLGLPKENIMAPVSEREVVQVNFPSFVAMLPEELKRDARYLSKFVAASSVGLFDAALNYVWNEVVLNLRKKAIVYGLDLFYDAAIGGNKRDFYKTEDDLPGIMDKTLLDACSKLELISSVLYQKLTHILIMRNDIGASHPNNASINAFELMGWLQTCVQEVINDTPSQAAIQIKALIDNLKAQTTEIDTVTIQHMQAGIKELPTHSADNVLQTLFGIYSGATSNQILKKNISHIAPTVWNQASEDVKYKLGVTLDGYKANLHTEKHSNGDEFFGLCNGNKYKTLEARVIMLDALMDELMSAHNGHNNYYTEAPYARQAMSYLNNDADIPLERREKIIKTFLTCRIGNGYDYCEGVSPAGKSIYDDFFSLLGDDNIIQVVIGLYDFSIKNMLYNKHGQNHARAILSALESNAISPKVKEILGYLLENSPSLENNMATTEFKNLASSHINFS